MESSMGESPETGGVQCPVCGEYVATEDLFEENGEKACDECVANGDAPASFYIN